MKRALITVLIVLVIDQVLKFYIKTNFYLGENLTLIPNIVDLYFIENEGFAFGWKVPGSWGKIGLTLFRILAAGLISFYLVRLVKTKAHKGLIICVALILAGAAGNIIDCLIYGVIFAASPEHSAAVATLFPDGGGYAPPLMGKVVDMFHFTARWPEWMPWLGGGEIFPPVFNVADASISVGVIIVVIRQRVFFAKPKPVESESSDEETPSEAIEGSPQEHPPNPHTS